MTLDIFGQFLQGVLAFWWLFALLGVASGLAAVAYFLKKTTRVEIPAAEEPEAGLPDAKSFLDKRGKGQQSPTPTPMPSPAPARIRPPSDDISEVFKMALAEKLRQSVMESDLSLAIDVPIRVEGNNVKAEFPDGEIGRLVLKSKEKNVVA